MTYSWYFVESLLSEWERCWTRRSVWLGQAPYSLIPVVLHMRMLSMRVFPYGIQRQGLGSSWYELPFFYVLFRALFYFFHFYSVHFHIVLYFIWDIQMFSIGLKYKFDLQKKNDTIFLVLFNMKLYFMKKYLLLLVLIISWILSSSTFANTLWWWGNYSKNKACKLPDGMYGYNIQITNYPWYNTFIKNFVKEGNMLYYAIQATPINEEWSTENMLWSWNCKTKKSKQISKELLSYYSHQHAIEYKSSAYFQSVNAGSPQVPDMISWWVPKIETYGEGEFSVQENSLELDYMDSDRFIIRYKIRYNTCVQYTFKLGVNSLITDKWCSAYRDIVRYRHVIIDRKTMSQSTLGIDPNEENYSMTPQFLEWYDNYVNSLKTKYDIIHCSVDNSIKQYTLNELRKIPENSKCEYYVMNPYVVNVDRSGKNIIFSIKYGDGIKGYWWYMDQIKIDLNKRKILDK